MATKHTRDLLLTFLALLTISCSAIAVSVHFVRASVEATEGE